MQWGTSRDGFCALDFVNHAMRCSGGVIRPDLQRLAVGEVMSAGTSGDGCTVAKLDLGCLLVLHIPTVAVGPARGAVVINTALAAGTEAVVGDSNGP